MDLIEHYRTVADVMLPHLGAGVATPIDWSELARATPGGYTIASTPRRLTRKSDPWADMDEHGSGAHDRPRP